MCGLRRRRVSHDSAVVCRRLPSYYYHYFYFTFAIIYYLSSLRLHSPQLALPFRGPPHTFPTLSPSSSPSPLFLTRVHFGARVYDVLVSGLIICYFFSYYYYSPSAFNSVFKFDIIVIITKKEMSIIISSITY